MARGKPGKAQLDMVSDMLSKHIDGPKGLRIRWHRRPQLWRAFRFDVFCEPGLGIKINGRPWDRPFCIRNRKPPNSGVAF